jgi:hypothetical protein
MVLWEKGNSRRSTDRPISLRFAFLLACLSRQALDLTRKFLPLSSYKTVQNHSGPQIRRITSHLSDPAELADFIGDEMEAHAIIQGTVVSLAIDAMAMTAQRTHFALGG